MSDRSYKLDVNQSPGMSDTRQCWLDYLRTQNADMTAKKWREIFARLDKVRKQADKGETP